MSNDTDALALAEAVTDRLCEAYDLPIDREQVHVGIARWTGRNGVCKYNKRLTKQRFGKRMSSQPRSMGEHAILVNERILDAGNREEFIDTVQHELAHAACYAEHGTSQNHNTNWKQMARKLGADPSSTHHKRDRSNEFEYYVGCPECGKKYGRTKRSKIIKQPFNRMCGKCGTGGLVSFDADKPMPEQNGTVAVESLDWNNRKEWKQAGCP